MKRKIFILLLPFFIALDIFFFQHFFYGIDKCCNLKRLCCRHRRWAFLYLFLSPSVFVSQQITKKKRILHTQGGWDLRKSSNGVVMEMAEDFIVLSFFSLVETHRLQFDIKKIKQFQYLIEKCKPCKFTNSLSAILDSNISSFVLFAHV